MRPRSLILTTLTALTIAGCSAPVGATDPSTAEPAMEAKPAKEFENSLAIQNALAAADIKCDGGHENERGEGSTITTCHTGKGKLVSKVFDKTADANEERDAFKAIGNMIGDNALIFGGKWTVAVMDRPDLVTKVHNALGGEIVKPEGDKG